MKGPVLALIWHPVWDWCVTGWGGLGEGQWWWGVYSPPGVSNPAACFFKSKSPSCFSILGGKNRCQTVIQEKLWSVLVSELFLAGGKGVAVMDLAPAEQR